jgi:hypothetical protein
MKNPMIFSAWMGPGEMTANRESALLSLFRHTGCANAHVTRETVKDWIDPLFPIHPVFPYLSAVHQCDYLRCYLLHVHGGGYTDIKLTSKNWRPFFDMVEASPAYGAGYPEVGAHGVARVGGALEQEMQANYHKLVGVCALIFRPQTKFTSEWFALLNQLLDSKATAVIQNPARHPQDRLGAQFTDGSISAYPFAWTEVGGDIFHPLAFKHSEHIIQCDMAPSFENYR